MRFMDKRLLALNGVFAVYKPKGETSARTIERVKTHLLRAALGPNHLGRDFKRLARQLKVGHGGTLDPLATGVLVVGLNGGCRALGPYLAGRKAYRAEGRFGEHHDTLDCTGRLLHRDAAWEDKTALVDGVMSEFVGEAVLQRPPAFSAIHVNGVRAHQLARQEQQEREERPQTEEGVNSAETADPVTVDMTGVDTENTVDIPDAVITLPTTDKKHLKEASFDIPARPVTVYALKYTPLELPQFLLEVECGGGCYVRSLIRDIAARVGTVATMTALERTQQGVFTVEMCLRDVDQWGNIDAVQEAITRAAQLVK